MTEKMSYFGVFSLLISQLVRKFNLLERDEKVCFGVTIPQCLTLETISSKGKLSMKALSLEMGVAISTMTRILDVMARDGLVRRENSPNDRRRVYVELTAKGKTIALKLKQCSQDYLRSIFNKLPKNKQVNINEALKCLLAAFELNPSCCQKR